METVGIEPATSALQGRRSPNVSYIPKAFLARVPANITVLVSREGIEPSTARIKSRRLCH